MQAHQKSIKDGIQNILFPVEHMNITQGNNRIILTSGS